MEILPYFWISNFSDPYLKLIKEKNIKVVIYLSKSNNFLKNENIEQLRIPIEYNENDNYEDINNIMYQQLYDITQFIHEKINNNQKVLLIGIDDKQDIDTIVSAYYIRYGKLTLRDALLFLKSKKKNIFYPKCNFYPALNKFYHYMSK
jgi:protein-tyrosine phosphatase